MARLYIASQRHLARGDSNAVPYLDLPRLSPPDFVRPRGFLPLENHPDRRAFRPLWNPDQPCAGWMRAKGCHKCNRLCMSAIDKFQRKMSIFEGVEFGMIG